MTVTVVTPFNYDLSIPLALPGYSLNSFSFIIQLFAPSISTSPKYLCSVFNLFVLFFLIVWLFHSFTVLVFPSFHFNIVSLTDAELHVNIFTKCLYHSH